MLCSAGAPANVRRGPFTPSDSINVDVLHSRASRHERKQRVPFLPATGTLIASCIKVAKYKPSAMPVCTLQLPHAFCSCMWASQHPCSSACSFTHCSHNLCCSMVS